MSEPTRRCVYCRRDFPREELTVDHVVARSWYPRKPLGKIQRITAPSCRECNERYSRAERYSLQRLAACVDTAREASEGVWETAFRSLRIQDAKGERDRRHRRAAWDAFTRDMREIQEGAIPSALPSFAANRTYGSKTAVLIDAAKLNSVIEKWALGFHPVHWDHPATPDAKIEILHLTEADALIAFQELEEYWKTIDQGVGVHVRYLAVREGNRRRTIYEFTIWQQFKVWCSVDEILID